MIYRYFDPDNSSHSNTNAYLCALLSFYIYRGEPPGRGLFETRFKSLFTDLSKSDPFDIEIFTQDDTELAILSNSEVVLVVFRGTDDWHEWVTDPIGSNIPSSMQGVPPDWGANVRVHQGFYRALFVSQVYASVRAEVRARMGSGRHLFLTGHSRGAAIATLCAYSLRMVDHINVSGVYLFGCPRVGDINFRIRYTNAGLWDRTHRWAKNQDTATMWPDYALGVPLAQNKYYHVGRLNFISQNGAVTMNHPNPDHEPGPLTNRDDHDMRNYCIMMYQRLSTRSRTSPGNPDYLVQTDVHGGGFPV